MPHVRPPLWVEKGLSKILGSDSVDKPIPGEGGMGLSKISFEEHVENPSKTIKQLALDVPWPCLGKPWALGRARAGPGPGPGPAQGPKFARAGPGPANFGPWAGPGPGPGRARPRAQGPGPWPRQAKIWPRQAKTWPRQVFGHVSKIVLNMFPICYPIFSQASWLVKLNLPDSPPTPRM